MIWEIDFDDLTQSFDMSYMIYTYMSLLATSHNLSPLKKCWFHPQTPNPKKKKHQNQSTKKMTQGIVGCTPTNVPLQEIPI